MITDPISINEHYVKLADVVVLGVDDPDGGPFRAHVETPERTAVSRAA